MKIMRNLLQCLVQRSLQRQCFIWITIKRQSPYGLNPNFCKKFWEIYGNDIYQQCYNWQEAGSLPSSINNTNIILILKCDDPDLMRDLKPIFLCNVAYKIQSKDFANRLIRVLHNCISEEQAAFIPNRSISNNILVATKVVHYLKCKTKGKKKELAFKIDSSKAYDRVDWGYLAATMTKMGFSQTWIKWINVSYFGCILNRGIHYPLICLLSILKDL